MSSLDTNQRRDKLVKNLRILYLRNQDLKKRSFAYIKTLLGFELEQEEDFNYNCILKNFKKDLSEDIEIFPDCVFSLINPDYKYKNENHDQCMVNSSIELFELLQSGLRINQKSLDDLLLLKAIESIYFNLPYYDACYHQKGSNHSINRRKPRIKTHKGKGFAITKFIIRKSDIRYHIDKNGTQTQLNRNNQELCILIRKIVSQFTIKRYTCKYNGLFNLKLQRIKIDLAQKWRGGQYLENQEDMWIRSGTPTQDVSTLIRNALIIKLNKGGFNIQSFLSGEGHEIFVMLNMQDSNLKIVADQGHVLKQLNFWFTDLFSLEPVDKSFRPLRINNRIWKSSDFEVSDLFLYLKPQMIRLIQQINFKRIARETNQSSINSQLFEYGKLDFSEKDDGPTDEEWIAYHKYLTHLENVLDNSDRVN